jgi:hypothetical protein
MSSIRVCVNRSQFCHRDRTKEYRSGKQSVEDFPTHAACKLFTLILLSLNECQIVVPLILVTAINVRPSLQFAFTASSPLVCLSVSVSCKAYPGSWPSWCCEQDFWGRAPFLFNVPSWPNDGNLQPGWQAARFHPETFHTRCDCVSNSLAVLSWFTWDHPLHIASTCSWLLIHYPIMHRPNNIWRFFMINAM